MSFSPGKSRRTRPYTLLSDRQTAFFRHRALITSAVSLILLFTLSSAGSSALSAAADTLTATPAASPAADTLTAAPVPPSPTPEGEPPETREGDRKPGAFTLLLVGRDRVGLNTDTLMVARLDTRERALNVVSIPRDTLVNVSWSVKKVNSIYGMAGLDGLLEGIEGLLGFPVDGYVIVNTTAFRELIDAAGGIWFEVPVDMHYDDPEQGLHISLTAGYQRLNGEQCEGLVRFRQNNNGTGYADGDLGRISVQHDFLAAAVRQLLSPSTIRILPAIVRILTENTDTDLTAGNNIFFLRALLKLERESVTFFTAPYELAEIRGGSYVSLRLEDWLAMVNEYLNPFLHSVDAEDMDLLMYDQRGFHVTRGSIPSLWSFFDYTAL